MSKVEFTITQMLHRGWTCELHYVEDRSGRPPWNKPKVFCAYFRKATDTGLFIGVGRQTDLFPAVEQARDHALSKESANG